MRQNPVDQKNADITAMIDRLGRQAKIAARHLALAPAGAKEKALQAAATALRCRSEKLMAANALDMAAAKEKNLNAASIDRLKLDPDRIEAMAVGLETVAALPDPIGEVVASWPRPNGLIIQRVRTPLGVVGVIYESRPNVTADAAALCLKAGNAVILRGGSESLRSAQVIAEAITEGLLQANLPEYAVQLVATADRAAVGALLQLQNYIDVIVPRGGKSLVERVMAEARVPVFAHLEGLCHSYIHESADIDKARRIVVNAKMRRPGVCGATETLLVDRKIAPTVLPLLTEDLRQAGCKLRGDAEVRAIVSQVMPATEADWQTEYLEAILAIKIVANLDEAIDHIARYGSHHTDAIIAENKQAAEKFLTEVDSAIVLHNASTQFADGAEFGFGTEIGIATGRLHARGPVGVEQLTTFKYKLRGDGQIRD